MGRKPKTLFSEGELAESKTILTELFESPNPLDSAYELLVSIKGNGPRRYLEDGSLHTCDLDSNDFPVELSHFGLTKIRGESHYGFHLNDSHVEAISKLYSQINWDVDVYKQAASQAEGFWPQFALNLQKTKFKVPKGHLGYAFHYLFGIAPNTFELCLEEARKNTWQSLRKLEDVVERVTDSPFMQVTGQIEIEASLEMKTMIIGEQLLLKFAMENFKCIHRSQQKCLICRSDFWPQSESYLPTLGHYGKVCVDCAMGGQPNSYVIKDRVALRALSVFAVTNFQDTFRTVPNARFDPKTYFMSDLANSSSGEFVKVFKTLSLLPWNETSMFPSWAHLLDEAGLLLQARKGHGGYQSIATDGHHCLSKGERDVCEFLTQRGIKHTKEPLYPFHPEYNPSRLLRADFKVGKVLVEFAGRLADRDYAARIELKRKLAETSGLIFVEVNPSNIKDLGFLENTIKESRRRKK